MLRFLTAGESHGPAEVAILEGLPAGLSISKTDIQKDLDRRKGGVGRGERGKIETDKVEILSGVRFGKTLGSPIVLMVENKDFANWQEIMAIKPLRSTGVKLKHPSGEVASHIGKITNPRPGHADLAGTIKYGFDDVRNVLERASARETVMRVAVGTICRKFLAEFDILIASHTIQIGNIRMSMRLHDKKYVFKTVFKVDSTDPEIRCIDSNTSQEMKKVILKAIKNKNTLGGIIEIIVHNVSPGLGSHVHFDRRLDGLLAQHLMSIPSVKAVEIGEGIVNSSKFGSEVHDEIIKGDTLLKGVTLQRKTNRAGGIEGGISNGEDIVCRVYHKPISTLGNPLNTIDIKTKKPTKALIERSDTCVIPRAGVISEAAVAFVIAQAFLEKFGGDSIGETKRNHKAYIKSLRPACRQGR